MKKNNVIKVIISISSVLLISIGSTYAYFSANITGNESSSTISVSGGTLSIVMDGGSTILTSNIYPSSNPIASKTITITGTNSLSIKMPYTMKLIIDSNTFSSGSIKYTLVSTNTDSNGTIIPSISTQTSLTTGTSTTNLGYGNFANGSNKVHTYVLNLYFPDSESNQNGEQGKNISARVEVVADIVGEQPDGWTSAPSGTLLYAIKNTNTLTNPQTIPGKEISTSGEAVFASTPDDYGTSYYFRGNVTNNYIVFANMCWRIVRVTGDGSIKLVLYNYNAGSVGNPCDVSQDGTTNAFARYSGEIYYTEFNLNYNNNTYIGFMYGTAGSSTYASEHANNNKSELLTNLETWYTSKLSSYASYLADTIWCNDKKIDTIYPGTENLGYGTSTTKYSANGRIYAEGLYATSANPSLICLNDTSGGKLSKFTADETTIGNGALTYKIGLLTVDEAAYAGGISSAANLSYYLYKNSNSLFWWTISPCSFDGNAFVWYINSSLVLGSARVNYSAGLRPAVSLISTTTVTGVGTSANPYVVS